MHHSKLPQGHLQHQGQWKHMQLKGRNYSGTSHDEQFGPHGVQRELNKTFSQPWMLYWLKEKVNVVFPFAVINLLTWATDMADRTSFLMLQLNATCSDPTHTCTYIYGFLFYGTASTCCLCPSKHYLLHNQLKQKNILHAKHFGLIKISRPL